MPSPKSANPTGRAVDPRSDYTQSNRGGSQPRPCCFANPSLLRECSQKATIIAAIRVSHYVTPDGRDYFGDRLADQNREVRGRIQARLDRIIVGNFGDHRNLQGGIAELRLDFGPGYRVYYGRDGDDLVLLLAAGTKVRQTRDIEGARTLWRQYIQEKTDASSGA